MGKLRPRKFLQISFVSKTERNKHFGLEEKSLDFIDKRIARGWTEWQAINLDPPPFRARNRDETSRPTIFRELKEIQGRIFPDAPLGDFNLYLITNIQNGKKYIGITIGHLEVRLRAHFNDALTRPATSKLHRAIRKYRKENFVISLIRNDAADFFELGKQEIAEIEIQNAIASGYNTSIGGDTGFAKETTVDGVHFASREAAADFFGVDRRNFNKRIAKLGWTPREAAGLKKRHKYQHKIIRIGDEVFPSLIVAAEKFGVDYKTAWARNNSGWPIEAILGLTAPPDEKQMTQTVLIGDHKFTSQAEFAGFLGISPSLITRHKNTMLYEEIYKNI